MTVIEKDGLKQSRPSFLFFIFGFVLFPASVPKHQAPELQPPTSGTPGSGASVVHHRNLLLIPGVQIVYVFLRFL